MHVSLCIFLFNLISSNQSCSFFYVVILRFSINLVSYWSIIFIIIYLFNFFLLNFLRKFLWFLFVILNFSSYKGIPYAIIHYIYWNIHSFLMFLLVLLHFNSIKFCCFFCCININFYNSYVSNSFCFFFLLNSLVSELLHFNSTCDEFRIQI